MENEKLLLIDVCARLPYGVKVHVYNNEREKQDYGVDGYDADVDFNNFEKLKNKKFKPYLRPMSSMTEDEAREMFKTIITNPDVELISVEISHTKVRYRWKCNNGAFTYFLVFFYNAIRSIENMDWLNANHFDYRGLIPMGKALEATENMYKK